ncbi:unnamed protein product, partial [Ascophyllum nodosum]
RVSPRGEWRRHWRNGRGRGRFQIVGGDGNVLRNVPVGDPKGYQDVGSSGAL